MKRTACLVFFIFAFFCGQINARAADTLGISLQDTAALQKMLCKKWTPMYLAIGDRRRDIHPGEPSYLYLTFTADHRILISDNNNKNTGDKGTWAIDTAKMTIVMTIEAREVDVATLTNDSLVTQVDSRSFRPDKPSLLLKTFYKPSEN